MCKGAKKEGNFVRKNVNLIGFVQIQNTKKEKMIVKLKKIHRGKQYTVAAHAKLLINAKIVKSGKAKHLQWMKIKKNGQNMGVQSCVFTKILKRN